jgi:thiol-disulfide isomerase/thioredoxin
MKSFFITLTIVVAAVLFFVFQADNDLVVKLGVGDMVPDFEVQNSQGEVMRLSDYRGKPVFINFWATWCLFCLDELPLMAQLQEEHQGDYITLAINRGENVEDANEYLQDLGVIGRINHYYDTDDDLYRRFGSFGMPYSIFVDAKGVVRVIKSGVLTDPELRAHITTILES